MIPAAQAGEDGERKRRDHVFGRQREMSDAVVHRPEAGFDQMCVRLGGTRSQGKCATDRPGCSTEAERFHAMTHHRKQARVRPTPPKKPTSAASDAAASGRISHGIFITPLDHQHEPLDGPGRALGLDCRDGTATHLCENARQSIRTMDHLLLLRLMVLLGIANGAPIVATKLLGARFAAPLDGGLSLRDGAPVFGDSKTIRGLVASIGCTALVAPLLGFDWMLGAGFAAASLAGDLLSSFVKRRWKLEPHAEAFGMDQIPEALLPLVVYQSRLGLNSLEIMVLVGAFVLLAVLLSQLLFRLKIRDRPY